MPGYISAGSYHKCIFSFIGNCQIVFQGCFIILHSQQGMRDLAILRHHQHLMLSLFFILAILMVWISLKAKDVEQLVFLFAICISSSVKCLFMCFIHFLSGSFIIVFFKLLSFESSLYILDTGPLPDIWFPNIFFKFVACLFILLAGSFPEQKFFFYFVEA